MDWTPDNSSDEDTVASLLVPDQTSRNAFAELFDVLDQAGVDIVHRDGFDARGTVAYDISLRTHESETLAPTPSPEDYEEAYRQARHEILAGGAYDVAVDILGRHMAAAVQHLLDAQAGDSEFENPDRTAICDAMKTAEEQVRSALLSIAWETVEVDR